MMKAANPLDKRSFILGMVTAFSECVAAGCKRLAFSPPLTHADYELVQEEACDIIGKHGLISFHEENLDWQDSVRTEWILIAGRQETIEQYTALRKQGHSPMVSLRPFEELLSYRPELSVHTGYDAYRSIFPASEQPDARHTP